MENATSYPLCWPAGWKRSKTRTRARFSSGEHRWRPAAGGTGQTRYVHYTAVSVADGVERVLGELKRMGVGDWNVIISTNVRTKGDGLPYSNQKDPPDPGVAVYWKDRRGKQQCMAIDRYDRVADNLAAIAATLDAMRAIERHGGAEILERAFLGFQALPPPIQGGRPWRDVLGFAEDDPIKGGLSHIEARYKRLALERHPDMGPGSHEQMAELNQAIKEAREFYR